MGLPPLLVLTTTFYVSTAFSPLAWHRMYNIGVDGDALFMLPLATILKDILIGEEVNLLVARRG